jgi:hypothetical protein
MLNHVSRLLAFVVLALALIAPGAHAQTQTGTIEGKVVDQQGGVLPGVTATLTGQRGAQTAVTDGEGVYRFVGVAPGTYVLRIEMSGFVPQEKTDVVVSLGRTVTADFTLALGGLTESVEVSGAASTVDVKSAATDTSVSNQMLQMTPLYSSTATGLLNAAPGINSSSAYGGQASYGNALLLDGVDTRDPEGGSAWTFFNQNLIEEIQIGGLGAPAEYGGFTGAIINTVTKSGGNTFSGLFSYRYTNDGLAGKNVSESLLNQNPDLGEAAVTKELNDYTVQMGGPLKQNRAFFFLSVQRYQALSDPIGPVANSEDISPRINGKITFQPTANDTFVFGGQYDQYNLTGRVGYWPSAQATDNQTVTEDAPEWVWNAQWRRVFGSNSLLEAKLTGYDGYYYLDPVDPSPFTYDAETGSYSGGGGGLYYADRSRNQAQISFTKFADKFGRHSLKFGAEIERSSVRSQYQPYGPAGFYIYNYYGTQYRVSYGYDVQGDNRRTSAYVQDQWNAGRATLNIGLRMDRIRGFSPILDETVYTPKTAWGPRLGISYDLTGRGTTAVKAFWGRAYEGAASGFFSQATPGIQDYVWTEILPDGSLGEPDVLTPGQVYGISDDIKHPRVDDMNLSFETQIWGGNRITATGIWRTWGNFVNNVIADARFEEVTLTNELTGQPFTGYAWANPDESDESFLIRNVDGFQYLDIDGNVIATAAPERKYKALMLLLTNSLRNRLGYQISYVLSKAEGNVDNTGFGNWLGGTAWASPNTAVTNAYGELTNSRRHEFKAYFTYQVPRIDVLVGGNYTGTSGRPYAPYGQFGSGELGLPGSGRRQIYLEPRGSRRTEAFHQLDLRVEKAFHIDTHRFGVYADFANVFNGSRITSVQTRYPSSGGVDFEAPTGVQGARQVTFGARWAF